MWRYGAIVLSTALALGSAASAATPANAALPGGAARPGSLLAGSSRPQGVYCTSSTSCWAAGFRAIKNGAVVNELARWNGHGWAQVAVPSPGGAKSGDFNELFAVRCASAVNCWAVGSHNTSGRASLAQALHWNGATWSLKPVPEPGGTVTGDATELFDVSCTSARSCWAVGEYGHVGLGSGKIFNLALHWNGRTWSKISTPNPAGTKSGDVNVLDAVRCASPADCWAAGSQGTQGGVSVSLNEVLHWNGTKWSTQQVPSPGGAGSGSFSAIYGLSCTSVTDCWAVGEYGRSSGKSFFVNQALHWNGHTWSKIATPNPDGKATGATNVLNSVNCTTADNCWAVGNLGDVSSGGSQTGEALRWTGKAWKRVATPDPAGTTNQALNALNSVRCVSAKDCWIAGYSQVNGNPDVSMFLHWNGKKWSVG